MTRNIGLILLSLYLILSGLLIVTNLTIAGANVVLGFLAILAGVFIVFQR